MKEIITNEFIQYKSGFIAGKTEIIEAYKLGKMISLNQNEQEQEQENLDSWYQDGYQDGFSYFSMLIDNQTLNLETINTKEIIKQCFTKRVTMKNQEQHQETPIGKFKR